MKCNLRDGAMLGAKNNSSIHHENQGEKEGKKLFKIFHSLLPMENTATSTCVLTIRILTVKFSVVQFFIIFLLNRDTMTALVESQFLANKQR